MVAVHTLEIMPVADDVVHILADLYALEREIKDDMTYHRSNYVVMRLVTVFERLLKILASQSNTVIDNAHKKIGVDVTTMRTILNMHAEPTYMIKRIMAETRSYQNINAVEGYLQNHKSLNGEPFTLTDKEKKNLDNLFRLRHRLTHTADWLIIKKDQLSIFHNTVLKLTMRLIQEYTPLSELFAKAGAYQNLQRHDLARKHFKEIIQLHKSKFPRNMREILEYGMACLEVGELQQALYVFNMATKKPGFPDSNIDNRELLMFYLMGGIIFTDLKRYQDAAESLGRGLEIAPTIPALLFQMTKVQLKLRNIDYALECALRTLLTPSVLSDSYYCLSEVYDALGNESIAKILRRYHGYEKSKNAEKQFTISQYEPEP